MAASITESSTALEDSTALLDASLASRRTFLKGALTAGVVAAGFAASRVHAQTPTPAAAAAIKQILSVAATAEQLAVTFYTQGLNHATDLGLTGASLNIIIASLIEEQIHQQFFVAQGGVPATDTFSFPSGLATFTDLGKFIATQQELEGVFDAAFLSAVKEFASPPIQDSGLAQIAAQIAMIESEHRVLGRSIGGLSPADNQAYAPVYLHTVHEATAHLFAAGYLNPLGANSFTYQAASFTDDRLNGIFKLILNQTPTAAQSGT